MAATVRIAILANANRAKVSIDRTRKSLVGLGKAAKGVGKMVAPLAAFTSLIGPATAGVLGLVKGLVAVGKAAAGLAPLLAFGPSLVGGFFLLKTTLTTVGTAMGEALAPVTKAFEATNKSVSALAQRGLPALGRQFVKVNMPAIDSAMKRIARNANANVRSFGEWVNTGPGMKLIRDTTSGIATAFERAAPHITTAVKALGNLANRAGVADRLAGLGNIVGDLADRFTKWANSVTASDITGALRDVRKAAENAREKFNALREVVQWMADNQDKIKLFSNTLAGVGLVVGALTGNWVAVAVAGFTLLLNNFDFVKSAFTALRDFWNTTWQSISTNPAFIALRQAVIDLFRAIQTEAKPLWESLKTELAPAFTVVKDVIVNDLVPAVTTFIRAITPIVAYLVRVFGPVVVSIFKGVVLTIGAALKIIAGILNVFSALLTGDWKTLWRGIKQIVSGAWAAIKTTFSLGKAALLANLRGLKDGIVGLFKNAATLLYGAGKNIVQGLWQGIKAMGGYISGLVSGFIEDKILGPIRRALRLGSPSKVARGYGSFFGQGLALGVLDEAQRIESAALSAAQAIQAPFTSAVDLSTGSSRVDVKTTKKETMDVRLVVALESGQILKEVRKEVRVNGGDVQVVLGRG